jgi:hypothetical protein
MTRECLRFKTGDDALPASRKQRRDQTADRKRPRNGSVEATIGMIEAAAFGANGVGAVRRNSSPDRATGV